MARIELIGVRKDYGKTRALKGIDLVIEDKEFLVLFGPAGAGKTTMLKLIAGIEMPTQGYIKINGEIVNRVEAAQRNVAMVFENYALYPNMTVYDNIAFPLRSKLYRETEDVIREKVLHVTKIMRIDQLLERLPSQISNGQKQRVALGRSLVRNPNLYLMDEPLAHLDAKMRHFMRAELKEMQSVFNTTTLYVTHDYMEALSLGDRIAIIDEGTIVQIGTGKDIYNRPVDEFVARLVGEPEINILPAVLHRENGALYVRLLGAELPVPPAGQGAMLREYDGNSVDFAIRAQHVRYCFEKPDGPCVRGKVYSFEPIGNKAILIVDADGTQIRITAPNVLNAEINTEIYLTFKMEKSLFFSADEKRLIAFAAPEQTNAEE